MNDIVLIFYLLFFAFSFILEFWCVSVRSNFRALFILGKEKRNWNHYFTWFLIFNPLHGKSTATFVNHFRLQKNKNLGAQNHYMVLNYFLMAKATTFWLSSRAKAELFLVQHPWNKLKVPPCSIQLDFYKSPYQVFLVNAPCFIL